MLPPEGVLPGLSLSGPTPQQEEQDPRLLELEQDPPNWREHTPPDTLKDLSKKETKRQEVINGEEGWGMEASSLRRRKETNCGVRMSCCYSDAKYSELIHTRVISLTLRVVCDGARPRAHAECSADRVLEASGERGTHDRHRAGHHLPQPGRDHRHAL